MPQTREEILAKKVISERKRRERMKEAGTYKEHRRREHEALYARLQQDPDRYEAHKASGRRFTNANRAGWTDERKAERSAYMMEWRCENPEVLRGYRDKRFAKDRLAFLLYNAKRNAEKKGVPFNLTRDDIVVPNVCPVLGIPLDVSIPNRVPRHDAPSLDRLIPELGYVKGNVYIISNRANVIKSNGTAAEHDAVAAYIRARGGS